MRENLLTECFFGSVKSFFLMRKMLFNIVIDIDINNKLGRQYFNDEIRFFFAFLSKQQSDILINDMHFL